MATGTLNLTFESPDLNLAGMGEFDVSDVFKRLFAENPAIQEEVSRKVLEIFKSVDAEEIGKLQGIPKKDLLKCLRKLVALDLAKEVRGKFLPAQSQWYRHADRFQLWSHPSGDAGFGPEICSRHRAPGYL